ncbi:hypothetical protein IMSAGC007_04515 [Lachnospiraceae bacterium]|nr:hypothetical protein IMSAGC007_04515 [Lachnospiraceae bacterium]
MMSCASGNSRRLSIKFMCVTLPYMSIGPRVVIAITFQQVDDAPDSKAGSECDNEGLQNVDCAVEKFHTLI